MSEDKVEKQSENSENKPSKIPLILSGVNLLALLGLLGVVYYTRVLYKRPKITESIERKKIQEQLALEALQKKNSVGVRSIMMLEGISANLKPTELGEKIQGGPPVTLKPHFAQIRFGLELFDKRYEEQVKAELPKFSDQILKALSVLSVEEISSVQGRITLKNRIIGIMNELTRKSKADPPIVTNVFFTEFTIQ